MVVIAIVTVRLPRNPKHDPQHKVAGRCPLSKTGLCTDVTGEHHSYIETGISLEDIRKKAEQKWGHVTRIEELGKFYQT